MARFANSRWTAPIVFTLLTAIVLGDVLIAPAHRVISSPGGDLTLQFISWRQFGFEQLSHGNLPLWNPHVFGGTPYFSGFQSALLYPPNWLHLMLSLARAIDWIVALHVFAAGYFTYLWSRRRATVAGSILAGAMLMLCGPYFLHIYAGHLPHNAVIVWIPLILLAIDGLVEAMQPLRWILLGSAALSMQILAGHPQYAYYTGIVAAVYLIVSLIARSRRTVLIAAGGFVAMYLAAAGISAIQLLPGIAATRDMVRSGGLPYEMAGTFSLPPENLLTALVPNAFGPLQVADGQEPPGQQYFGRAYLWETSLFLSVTGLILATIGAIRGRDKRARFTALAMLLLCIALALGRHTPLYRMMYDLVPQYGSFRGTVKFAVFAAAFASMLAAMGFDRLLEKPLDRKPLVAAISVTVIAAIVVLLMHTSGAWARTLATIASARTENAGNELFVNLPTSTYADADFIRQSARAAAGRATVAAGVAAFCALLIFLRRFRPSIVYLLPAVAAIELIVFARGAVATTSIIPQVPLTWLDALRRTPGDYRVLVVDAGRQNSGMYYGFDNLWGYDPGVLKRYAELMFFSQSFSPSQASQYLAWRQPSPNIFRAMRCRFVFQDPPPQRNPPPPQVTELPFVPLPTALLIRNYSVLNSRDAILASMISDGFDPASSVLLEREPDPKPVKGASLGTVEVTMRSTNSLELRVDIETPAILLVTNNYTPDWTARPANGDAKQEYRIQPANWSQQAIALNAGKHHIVLEYSPRSFRVGRWVSALSIIAVISVAARLLLLRSRPTTD